MPAMALSEEKHIIILGAGITALSTSLALRISPATSDFIQTIIATYLPGDSSIDYTSPNAGGHWRSFASTSEEDAEIRNWDKKTYEAWMDILDGGDESREEEVEGEVGLGVRESRNYWAKETSETEGHDGRGLWWSAPRYRDMSMEDPVHFTGGVKGFEVLNLPKEQNADDGEAVPKGAIFGVKYQSVCINIPQYLSHLLHRVRESGTNIIKTTVDTSSGLPGVVKHSKQILMRQKPGAKEDDIKFLINCTGLSARHFVGATEAEKLYPIRGQTLLVRGEARKARTFVGFGLEDELVYVIPRPRSGTTILGGCKQVGNWSGELDDELNERIMERAREWGLAEELRTGEGGEFEVLGRQVGLRPGRKGGPRVELDEEGNLEGVWVVHSYGQAGGGYQCSIGCGGRVAEIVGACDTMSKP